VLQTTSPRHPGPSHSMGPDPETFRRTGVCWAPALIGADRTAQISGWVRYLQSRPESPDPGMMYFEEHGAGRLLNRIENFEPYHRELSALISGPELLGTASALLGSDALLFKDKVNFKLPGGGGFEAHQDVQAGWDRYASLFITAAVALDPASPENGCLELAHWPHRRERIGPLWQALSEAQLRGIEFQPHPMAPGDVIFFDSFLPHRSGPNPTANPRRLLYITYNRADEGDQRSRYYADKRESFPPDCARIPGEVYRYRI